MKLFIFSASYKQEEGFTHFDRIEKQLTAAGYDVINPLKLEGVQEAGWKNQMRIFISGLMQCDKVAFFGTWKNSRSCQFLLSIAYTLKMEIAKVNWWLNKRSCNEFITANAKGGVR